MSQPQRSSTVARVRRGPGRPPAADSDAADVRERLLDAATALAIERGVDGASIREIADRAEVSSAMVAYYFGDRQGLHDAIFERAVDEITRQFEEALEHPEPGGDLLATLLQIHATAMAANPWLPRVIAREVLGEGGSFRARFREILGDRPLQLRDAVESEIAAGRLRADLDPALCVVTLISLTAFPYLAGPLLGDILDFELDDAFRDRLIAHNREVVIQGLRAPDDKGKP